MKRYVILIERLQVYLIVVCFPQCHINSHILPICLSPHGHKHGRLCYISSPHLIAQTLSSQSPGYNYTVQSNEAKSFFILLSERHLKDIKLACPRGCFVSPVRSYPPTSAPTLHFCSPAFHYHCLGSMSIADA